MVNEDYIPERGDIVWLNFTPQSGHEQAGKRAAIVITPGSYNKITSLALFCPITSQIKGYPFEVKLPANFPVKGVIISDQIKSLDWRTRKIEFIAKAPKNILKEVLSKLSLLIN